jgi:hypothetical protein
VKEGFELLVMEIHKKFEHAGEFEGVTVKREILVGKKEETNRKNCAC